MDLGRGKNYSFLNQILKLWTLGRGTALFGRSSQYRCPQTMYD